MLRALDQLAETDKVVATCLALFMMNIQKQGFVTLYNKWGISHHAFPNAV